MFLDWVKTGEPRENSHGHRENMQTPPTEVGDDSEKNTCHICHQAVKQNMNNIKLFLNIQYPVLNNVTTYSISFIFRHTFGITVALLFVA